MYVLPIKQPLIQPLIPLTTSNIMMINKPDSYLLTSVLLETMATCSLKYTLVNKFWYIPVYIGYGISFYIFPKCFVKYSLSTAYLLWCGLGIIFTNSFDYFIYKEILTIKKILSIMFIIFGIKLAN